MSEMERSKERHGERADAGETDEPTQNPADDDFEAHRHADRADGGGHEADRADGGGHEAERHDAGRNTD